MYETLNFSVLNLTLAVMALEYFCGNVNDH